MTELVQKGTLPTLEQLDDAGKAVVVNPAGSNYTLGTAQSGASASYLVASFPEVGGLADGFDHYPVSTAVTSTGTDIAVAGGVLSILTAGMYDFRVSFQVTAGTTVAIGHLLAWLDEFPDFDGATLEELRVPAEAQQRLIRTITLSSVVVAAPTTVSFNVTLAGTGAWWFNGGRIALRKVA